MSRIHLLVILLLSALLTSCKSTYDEEMPADFSFVYKTVPSHVYDSAKGTYTKHYVRGDSVRHIPLSLAQKKAFYRAFCEADFMHFPEEFECFSGGGFPFLPEILTIRYKGMVKRVTYNPACRPSPLEWTKVKRFEALTSQLWDWITKQKGIKELPALEGLEIM